MKKFLWDNKSLIEACPAAVLNGLCTGNKICIDSRDIQTGDIFVAFKGQNVDGHDYVTTALKKGASCAIVEYKPKDMENKDNLMIVPNAKDALRNLAIFNRNRSKAKILGVTGSVGKTSTKEALYIACSSVGKSYRTIKNFNNDLGLPISLASMPMDTKYGIFELGMDHKGEIAELTKILRPHLALITKIAKVHIANFKSIEDIAHAKGEIFLSMKDNDIAILNGDDKYSSILTKLASNQNIKTICYFGEKLENESCLLKYEAGKNRIETSKIEAKILGEKITYKIKAHGKHHAINTVAALTAIRKLGIDIKIAAKALLNFSNIEGRGEILELKIGKKNITIIDESYNANPTSIEAALKTVKEINDNQSSQRTVAVLGDMVKDMIETGTSTKELHTKLLEPFEDSGINKLITVGSSMKNLFNLVEPNKRLVHFADYNKAKESIISYIQDGDCLLFKGSHSTKIYEIVKYLKEQTT